MFREKDAGVFERYVQLLFFSTPMTVVLSVGPVKHSPE